MKYGRNGYLLEECPRNIIFSVLKSINEERLQFVVSFFYIYSSICVQYFLNSAQY